MLHDQENSLECAKFFANSYQYENAQDGTNGYMMFFYVLFGDMMHGLFRGRSLCGGRGLFWGGVVGVACDVLPGPAGVVWVG